MRKNKPYKRQSSSNINALPQSFSSPIHLNFPKFPVTQSHKHLQPDANSTELEKRGRQRSERGGGVGVDKGGGGGGADFPIRTKMTDSKLIGLFCMKKRRKRKKKGNTFLVTLKSGVCMYIIYI